MGTSQHPAGFEFDTQQTAAYLGISPKTLHNWASARIELRFVRVGGKRWYRKLDCDRLLKSRTQEVVA